MRSNAVARFPQRLQKPETFRPGAGTRSALRCEVTSLNAKHGRDLSAVCFYGLTGLQCADATLTKASKSGVMVGLTLTMASGCHCTEMQKG